MAQEFKIGRLRFTWAGAWLPGTMYARDTVVSYQGKTYVCLVPNTSSSISFYNDLNASTPLWNLILDGKSFLGIWSTGTYYSLGNIVIFGGFVYYCNTPHTSTTFVSQSGNWSIYTEFTHWLLSWQPNTVYGVNDVVTYGGTVYKCIADHTSAGTLQATGAVATGSQLTINFNAYTVPVFATGTSVTLSGFVPTQINGVYTVVSSTISSVTFNSSIVLGGNISTAGIAVGVSQLGLELNQSAWTVLDQGVSYTGAWTPNTRYKLNDIVQVGGNLYICTQYFVSASSFSYPTSSSWTTNWSVWIPDERYMSAWNSSSVYQVGDIVTYGGNNYINNTIGNQNNVPPFDTTDWTLIVPGSTTPVDWIVGGSYTIGTVVRRNGQLFQAVIDNTAQDPTAISIATTYTAAGSSGTTMVVASTTGVQVGMIVIGAGFSLGQAVNAIPVAGTVTLNYAPDGTLTNGQAINFVGINYTYWKLLNPGVLWTNRWATGNSYAVGDLVIWQNATYQCDQTHTSTALNRPDLDVANTYWKIYVDHFRKNALNTLGDIESYKNGSYNAISAGTTGFVLRSTSNYPTWSQINTSNNVFYVSTLTGLDSPNYGRSWDRPWKTIAYAAAFVGAGTQNPNAVALLTSNKSWMLAEMVQWANYQINNNISPYTTSYAFNSTKAARDAGLIIDAIAYDLARGGNSQTVAAALSFFAYGQTNTFISTAVAADVPYYLPMLSYLNNLISYALGQVAPGTSYQSVNGINPVVYQNTSGPAAEGTTVVQASSLFTYIYTALTNQSTALLPTQNQGVACTIFVKTGNYYETLPIVVPANVAIIGDELRGVVVQPRTNIFTTCTATTAGTNLFTVTSTNGLADQMPIQFADPTISTTAVYTAIGGNVVAGQTYYVIGSTITSTQFSVAQSPTTTFTGNTTINSQTITDVPNIIGLAVGATITGAGIQSGTTITNITTAPSNSSLNSITISTAATATAIGITLVSTGAVLPLTTATGTMNVYAGDCLKDMFRVRNGTGVRNMTLTGLQGTLLAPDAYQIQRPSGGSYCAFDPGTGPNDSTTWIVRRSPFFENVTTFGNGASGAKIDGTLHNGGNKSMVFNDFTQVINDGIGIWCTGPGALTECISVFCYYGYTGYFAEAGGRIRAANGNSSYGSYGVISEGYDLTETPVIGTIYNQSSQVQASVQSSLGSAAQLIKLNYSNAGSAYNTTTTNLLNYSNNFLGSSWNTDGNIIFTKTFTAPTGNVEAYTMTGTGASSTGYIYQNISINPAGATYTNVPSTTISGTGGGATFNVTVTNTSYVVTVNNGGTGYAIGNQVSISGALLGGKASVNDCIITVNSLSGNSILSIVSAGTIPTGSAQNYTASVYVYQGTSTQIDIQAIYSGTSTRTSAINYNFTTGVVTPSNANSGFLPTQYGAQVTLVTGWYRLWFAFNDSSGLNNAIQLRIYPKGLTGSANTYNYLYGAQLEISPSTFSPSFYLETQATRYSAYANYNITGAGTGASLLGDELRSSGIFQSLVTTGGSGYLTASNNAQGGTNQYVTLSASDVNQPSNYIGMRVFIQSGTGAGQYGYIASFNTTSKQAYVLRESFTPLQIASSSAVTGAFTLASNSSTNSLYVGMPAQFIPTYYTTSVTSTSLSQTTVTQATGGTTNTLTVSSTVGLTVNMPVYFTAGSGAVFSNVTVGYTYYIATIVNSTTIQIATQSFGAVWPLTSASGTMVLNFTSGTSYIQASTSNMTVNYPIQFTGTSIGGLSIGTTYYINDVIDSNDFTISNATVSVTVTATNSVNNGLTVASTANLAILNPIVFTAPAISGSGIADTTKYYISTIIDAFTFTISSSIITQPVTVTTGGTNLITTTSTSNFVVNQPVIFTGTSFGGIQTETVYYISSISGDGVTFTVSQTLGGGTLVLSSATGAMVLRTCPAPLTLTTTSGSSMVGVSTSKKISVNLGLGTMTGTFSTSLFGGVSPATTYYIASIVTPGTGGQFTLSSTSNLATPVTLLTKTGTMNVAACGWDHVISGYPIVPSLDSTSVYYIEPRPTFSAPGFYQSVASATVTLANSVNWIAIGYGNNTFIALPSANAVGAVSTDGSLWSSLALPYSASWTGIAFGNNYFVAINSTNSNVAYSNSNGAGWRTSTLPSNPSGGWGFVAYGNGTFVALNKGGTSAAYSTNFGLTWTSATMPVNQTQWTGLAWGGGVWIAVANNSSTVCYSLDGITWVTSLTINGLVTPLVLPTSSAWSGIAYGNGRFVVVASDGSAPSYSFDGINWNQANIGVVATLIKYGQGSFVAVSNGATVAYNSENGLDWTIRTVTNDGYTSLGFGFTSGNNGVFPTLSGQNVGSVIVSGVRAKGRPQITSGGMVSVSEFEPGSGYITQTISSFVSATASGGTAVLTFSSTQNSVPYFNGSTIVVSGFTPSALNGTFIVTASSTTSVSYSLAGSYTATVFGSVSSLATLSFTDPNVTSLASVTVRSSNGVLGNPTFVNKGTGYNSTTTSVAITGNGYADTYQVGLNLVVNNLTLLPSQGSNLTIAGNTTQVYKITSATAVFGTVAPTLQANIAISPAMTLALSPGNGAVVTIRQKYSQCRITNHDFLNIGYGDQANSNYPGYPAAGYSSIPGNQVVEVNFGRVFFTSTDQDGNFKVGNLFGVQQATGIVTLSASQFGLSGLSALSLGGISVGGSSVQVNQFSTDGTFTANSDAIIPTQKAIRTYLTSRLSQGGSNTFTGLITAGTVQIGGPNFIRSSIPNGQTGSVVKMVNKVYVNASGVDGNMVALDFFMNNSVHKSTSQQ